MNALQYSKELALFFDLLRFHRKMSQESFTADIVSLRQYRRYLNGEYQIPQYVVNKLSKRLGFKPEYLLLEFEASKMKETQEVNKYHNLVVGYDFVNAEIMRVSLSANHLLDENNQLIFKYANLQFDFYVHKISEISLISSIKDLISYQTVIENTSFSSTEIIILTSLLSINSFNEKEIIVNLLNDFLENDKFIISGHNQKTILLCLYRLADYSGSCKNYDSVLDFCNKGITYCNLLKFHYLLEDFYYYSALAFFALKKVDSAHEMLYRCYCILHIENNSAKRKKYYQYIEGDFNITDFDEFIIAYLSEHK
jgi:predicted nucleic-acid-binding protein